MTDGRPKEKTFMERHAELAARKLVMALDEDGCYIADAVYSVEGKNLKEALERAFLQGVEQARRGDL